MSLEFMDGFDHYNTTASALRKWDASSSVGGFFAGRFTGQSIGFTNQVGFVKTLTSIATRTMGFAYKCVALPSPYYIISIFQDAGSTQVDLRLLPSGQLEVTRNGTVLGTSSVASPMVANTWYYVEWQATINATTGSFTVRVTSGGVLATWLTGTSQNTQNTSNATSNQVSVLSGGGGAASYFDDFYCLNPSGSVNNTFLGESRIVTNLPSADSGSAGTNTLWTPDTAGTHFSRVNESTGSFPDDDTSYVYSQTAGQLDTYKYPSATLTGTIAGVQVTLCERKDNTGARTTAVEYRSSGGTNYTGSNSFSPGSSYEMDRQIYETDPATSAAWTQTGINGAEFGINLVA